jgi:hypothetical protein
VSGARYNSGAWLDAISVALPVPAAALHDMLARDGLVAHPVEGAPPDVHPLFLDLWRVTDGRAELVGIDQHEWAERAGAVSAGLTGAGIGAFWGALAAGANGAAAAGRAGARFGPWGSLVGAAFGSVMGAAAGAASGALQGGSRLAALSGQVARRASEQLSHTVGSYHEVVAGVPNVGRPGGPLRMFVLGMYSDNLVAIWGDRMLRTGYRKQLASIEAAGATAVAVAVDGARVLDVSIDVDPGATSTDAVPVPFDRFFAQPLLGRLGDGGLVASVVERSFAAPARLLPPGRARVAIGPGFFDGVPPGAYGAGPPEAGSPFGVLRAAGVPARLTFPEPA